MGFRVAIIIGVSKYLRQDDELPASEEDAELIEKILELSGRYESIRKIDGNKSSLEVKEELANFIDSLKDKEIEEVFFYFSGHGKTGNENDFLYVLSDYQPSSSSQSTISNSYLDSLLKSLSPMRAIKIVDACYSGVEYVKSTQIIKEGLQKSIDGKFSSVYFMFSSRSDQTSWANAEYSFFTRSFVTSLTKYKEREIRYGNIIDFITDDMRSSKQTPIFVQQGDNLDVFAEINPSIVKYLSDILPSPEVVVASGEYAAESGKKLTLKDKVAALNESYADKNQAKDTLSAYFSLVNEHKFTDDLSSIYDWDVNLEDGYLVVTGMDYIAKWLEDNNLSYFVELEYGEESYEGKTKVVTKNTLSFTSTETYEPTTLYRKIVTGIYLTAESEYSSICINLTPKFEALSWYQMYFVHVFSKSKLRVFFKCEKLVEKNWDEREAENTAEWRQFSCGLTDVVELEGYVKKAIEVMEKDILAGVEVLVS